MNSFRFCDFKMKVIPSSLGISNVWNYQKLALFLCQMFIDGQFRSGHIIYHSNVFNDQFTTQIDSVCPHFIPWIITDIDQLSLHPFKKLVDTDDNILQVIFLDPQNLDEDMQYCIDLDYFKYYRIFVFQSTNEIEIEKQFLITKMYNPGYESSPLIMYYDSLSDELFINWMPMNDFDEGEWRPISLSVDPEANMFDRTFGEYEQNRTIAINILYPKV